VVAVIDLGGDTDTVAAVAGGLAGAVHGIQGIPCRWTTYLHGDVTTTGGPRTYRLADLESLALRLVGGTYAPHALLGQRRGPTEISQGLYAADLGGGHGRADRHSVISLCRPGDRSADHPVRCVDVWPVLSEWNTRLHDTSPGLTVLTADQRDEIAVESWLAVIPAHPTAV
jgi:ADP-ribosyl-[dinitrogen reductase] hydrolase